MSAAGSGAWLKPGTSCWRALLFFINIRPVMPETGWAGWRTGRRGQSVDEADRMGGGIARA